MGDVICLTYVMIITCLISIIHAFRKKKKIHCVTFNQFQRGLRYFNPLVHASEWKDCSGPPRKLPSRGCCFMAFRKSRGNWGWGEDKESCQGNDDVREKKARRGVSHFYRFSPVDLLVPFFPWDGNDPKSWPGYIACGHLESTWACEHKRILGLGWHSHMLAHQPQVKSNYLLKFLRWQPPQL